MAKLNSGERETCPRCRGTGNIPQWSHVAGGGCFLCKGAGTIRKQPQIKRKKLRPWMVNLDVPHDAGCDCGHWIDRPGECQQQIFRRLWGRG